MGECRGPGCKLWIPTAYSPQCSLESFGAAKGPLGKDDRSRSFIENGADALDWTELATAFSGRPFDEPVRKPVANNVEAGQIAQALRENMMREQRLSTRQHGCRYDGIKEACMASEQDDRTRREVGVVFPCDGCANDSANEAKQCAAVEAHESAIDVPSPALTADEAKTGE